MNAKIYNGNVQPNPKEFKIWVNDEGTIKTWNGTEWVENTTGEGGSGSGDSESWKYVDITNYTSTEKENLLQILPQLVRIKVSDNQHLVVCGGVLYYAGTEFVNTVNAIAFNASAKITLGDGFDFVTIKESYDFMVEVGAISIPFEELAFITEEEFYSHPK